MGFMGSGKSTLGRSLATAWQWHFIDLDKHIEANWEKPIPQIFDEEGENSFREKEREALVGILENANELVLAVGGGTPCFFDNIDLMLDHGHCVYLRLSIEELAVRLKRSFNPRPLLKGKTDDELKDYIRREIRRREPFYSRADHVVESDNLLINDLLTFIPRPQ